MARNLSSRSWLQALTDLRIATLVSIYALAGMAGMALAAGLPVLYWGLGLYTASAILMWMFLDARAHRRSLPRGLQWAAILTFPLSLIVYVLWHYTWRGALWLLLAYAGLLAVMFLAICFTEIVYLAASGT